MTTPCYVFKCDKCQAELVGPIAKQPRQNVATGRKFKFGNPVKCMNTVCRMVQPTMTYQGVLNRVPPPPPLPGQANTPAVPQNWVDGDAVPRYPHIPTLRQAALIAELEGLFANKSIPLLGAVFDRFDTYTDQLDEDVQPGAEKHLTVPLVLQRLNNVLAELAGSEVTWSQQSLDRNFGEESVDLTVPCKLTHAGHECWWSYEALNDLINPRGGHAIRAQDYGAALRKALALDHAGENGEDVRGQTHGFFVWSTTSNRGIKVVLKRAAKLWITTVYYSNAATAWFNNHAQTRVDRSI